MNILFYISTIRGGGAARVMVNIANGLFERNNNICFVTNFPAEHEYELRKGIKRINIERIESKKNIIAKNYFRVKALRSIIREEKPDVSIAFMGENNFRLILATRGLRTKSIVSVRNDPERAYGGPLRRKLANFLFSQADAIVFQTEDAKTWFPKTIQRKSKVIFNHVDEKFFNERKDIGLYIVACGRLSAQKNYPMLLRAFAKVQEILPDEELQIYGEGELKRELQDLAEELGIEDAVHFMGFATDMVEVYKKAKLLVMTSDYEGMPNVVLEALASSVPVIATDCPCGGPRMVIKEGINGYLVPVGDAEQLSNILQYVLLDEGRIKNMADKAYKMATVFRSKTILNEWSTFINNVVGGVRG